MVDIGMGGQIQELTFAELGEVSGGREDLQVLGTFSGRDAGTGRRVTFEVVGAASSTTISIGGVVVASRSSSVGTIGGSSSGSRGGGDIPSRDGSSKKKKK